MALEDLKMKEPETQAPVGAKKDKAPAKPRVYDPNFFTDTYLGEAFAERIDNRALFLPEEGKWLVYDSAGFWKDDVTGEVTREAKEWIKALNLEVSNNGNAAEEAAAARYLARTFRDNVVKDAGLARSVLSTVFDGQNDHLLVANGKVDLRDGSIEPASPADRFRKHSGIAYNPDAGTDLWDNVLRAFPEDTHDWLQIVVGQSLTGYMPSDGKAYFLKGDGKNGKSTFLDCLKAIAGSVANKVDNSLLISSKGNGPSPEKMALNGLRLAFLEELPEDNFLNAKMLKEVAGTPEVTARPLFGNYITFANRATLFITTNHLPKVAETDHGTWRRLIAIPTPYKFVKRSEMPENYVLGEFERWVNESLIRPTENRALLEQALAWAIRGAMKWYANNRVDPTIPQSVEHFTKAWLGREDKAGTWFEDCIELDESSFILAMDAYDSYREYTLAHGQKVEAYQGFVDKFSATERVKEAGLEVKRTTWAGLTQSKFTPSNARGSDDTKTRVAGRLAVLIKGVRFKTENDDALPTNGRSRLSMLEARRAELAAMLEDLDGKILLERTRDESVDELIGSDDDLLDDSF